VTRPVDPNPATRWTGAPKAPEPAAAPPVDTAKNLRDGADDLDYIATTYGGSWAGEIHRAADDARAAADELDAHRAMRAELVALVADLRNEATAAPKAATRVAMWKYHDRLTCILGEQS